MSVMIGGNAVTYVFLFLAVLLFSFDASLLLLLAQSNVSQWTIIFWRQLLQLLILILSYLSSSLLQKKHTMNESIEKFSKLGVW